MADVQTNALVRRSGDQRTRNRRAPVEVPTGNDRRLAKAEKYYCPSCGQVRRVASPVLLRQTTRDNVVLPHEFATGTRAVEYCPGGEFDREADAA